MADPTPRERLFRISLRELLLLLALCAVAIVSLRYASGPWQLVVFTITMVAAFVAAIVAVVDRGARQAFAIGFALSMALYGLIFLYGSARATDGRNLELNPQAGRLPTSRLLEPVYKALVEVRWIDLRTGQEVPGHDPTSASAAGASFVTADERPERGAFMRIGHCWWALLLGYLGGWFARWVYLQRNREPAAR